MISTSEKRRWGGREGRRSKFGNINKRPRVSENLEGHGSEDTKNQANTTCGFCTFCAVFRCAIRGASRVQIVGVGVGARARCLGGIRRSAEPSERKKGGKGEYMGTK
jgi:hypothetical protein